MGGVSTVSRNGKLRAVLYDHSYRRLLLSALPVVIVCGFLSMLAQHAATAIGASQPPGHDLLLDRLPVFDLFGFIVWGPVLMTAFLGWVVLRNPQYLPFTLKTIGLVFAVRAFFMVLTPLGIRTEVLDLGYGGLLKAFVYDPTTNDFFFSGHTAYPFSCALIFWSMPWVRSTFLLFAGGLAAAVLLAHAHYSIDVFSVPFMAGGVVWWAKKLFAPDYAYIQSLTPKNPVYPTSDA